MKKILVIAATTAAATIAMAQAPSTKTKAKVVAPAAMTATKTMAPAPTAAAIPAQTTTASASAAAPVATKPWSITMKTMADLNAAETRTLNSEINSENTISGKYSLTAKDTVSVAHVFYMNKSGINSDANDNASFGREPIQGGLNSIGYRRSTDVSLMGAKFAPGITLVNVADGPAVTPLTGGKVRNYITTDNNLSWTLSPKVSLDFYLQHRVYLRDQDAGARGQSAMNRFLQGTTLSYNANDSFSAYQAVSTIHSFDDGLAMRETRQRLALETGVNYSPAAVKGLAFNANINTDMTMSARSDMTATSSKPEGRAAHNGGLWESGSENTVLYEASASYTF